jgi:hypothetical protein
MAIIDTYSLIEEMVEAGVKKQQAVVFTKAINQSNDNLVTKSDLKLEMNKLSSELRAEISNTKHDLKEDISNLKHELELAIIKQKVDLLKWVMPMFLTNLLLIIGLWFK